MSKVLVVHDGKRERELLLVERLVVGRDPACDISFDDGLLSRRHAEFVASPSAVIVRDLDSRNGIFVNGTRCREQAIRPGDVVQIGPIRVRYVADRAAAPSSGTVDADGTRMLAGPPAPRHIAAAAPVDAPVINALDEDEGETRVVNAATLGLPLRDAVDEDQDVTSFTPTPRPAPLPLRMPLETVATPPVSTEAGDSALGSFVLFQLGALAGIVFIATVAPLVMSRGMVLEAIGEGRVSALLVWPLLPILVALAATIVIANVVNRRVLAAIAAGRHHLESR